METENIVAEAIFDFTPTDSIELALKVCVFVRVGDKIFCIVMASRAKVLIIWRFKLFMFRRETS